MLSAPCVPSILKSGINDAGLLALDDHVPESVTPNLGGGRNDPPSFAAKAAWSIQSSVEASTVSARAGGARRID